MNIPIKEILEHEDSIVGVDKTNLYFSTEIRPEFASHDSHIPHAVNFPSLSASQCDLGAQ